MGAGGLRDLRVDRHSLSRTGPALRTQPIAGQEEAEALGVGRGEETLREGRKLQGLGQQPLLGLRRLVVS